MKPGLSIAISIVCVLLAYLPAAAQDQRGEIERLIAELADDSFAARQTAMEKIWQSSELSIEKLREYARTADPDAAVRLQRIIEHMELGITPDTDPEVARLVFEFHRADEDQKFAIMYELRDKGHARLVMDLLNNLKDFSLRSYLANNAWERGENLAQSLIGQKQSLDAATLRELDQLMDHPLMWETHIEDCIVYWQLRGQSVEKIGSLEKLRADKTASDTELARLAWFYRMGGQPQQAIAVARELSRPDPALIQRLLIESGTWSELAGSYHWHIENEESHLATLCKTAMFRHWSGDQPGFAAEVEKLGQQATLKAANATAILGLATLDERLITARLDEMSPGFAFRILVYLQKYDRAFRLLDAPQEPAQRKLWYERQVNRLKQHIRNYQSRDATEELVHAMDLFGFLRHYARHVGLLEDTGQAIELFELLAEGVRYNGAWFRNWNVELFEELASLHIGDDIWHFFDVLEMGADFNQAANALFPGGASEAIVWYQMLNDEIEDPLDRAQLIAVLLQSPWAETGETCDLEMLVSLAREHIARYSPRYQMNYLYHVGRTCQVLGREDLARDLWLQAGFDGESRGFRKLAYLAVQAGDWATARSWFQQSLDARHNETDLFLVGVCDRQLGHVEAADRKQLTARLGQLHSFDLYRISSELEQLGVEREARELMRLYVRGRSEHNTDLYYDFQHLANLLKESNPTDAAIAWAAALHFYLTYLDESPDSGIRYHYLASQRQMTLARQSLRNGNHPAALRDLQRCANVANASSALAEEFVPLLEQYGLGHQADQLFDAIAERYRQVLNRYPNSALHHNNLAWACARCQRRLGEARQHAERAVELQPLNTSYLDTLAEIAFLQGEKEYAVQLIRKCVTLNPFKDHYRQQLQRFTSAADESASQDDR
ncbi:MAG: hypothetical protein ACR2NP_21415 [Pirellulaceae bacterium]